MILNYRFRRNLLLVIQLFALAVLSQTGCKENTLINSKVSPSNNAVSVLSYSLPVITHTYEDDTTVTSTNLGGIPIYQAVGAIYDPFFGTMTASTYFQLIPTDITPAIFADDSIDSAILILPYSGYTYGDTTSTGEGLTQTYQVFYMLDTMGLGSTYYASSTKPIDLAHPLSAPTTINISSLKDSFGINVIPSNYPSLRIKLNLANVMSRILPALDSASTNANPFLTFVDMFNGICVKTANANQYTNAIPYFELDGTTIYSEAAILVYYHPYGYPLDTTVTQNPEAYYFSTGSCAHFNSISKSHSRYPISNLIHSTQKNDSIIALSNQPGQSIDVMIPGIKSIPAGVINKAELQLALIPRYYSYLNLSDTLPAAENISPLGIGNGTYPAGVGAGLAYEIADRYPLTSLTPLTVMDGNLHAFTYGSTTVWKYTIDLPRETIASIAAGNDTIHLHLSGTSDYYGAFHAVLGGGGYNSAGADSMYVARFVVTYSKLKNP